MGGGGGMAVFHMSIADLNCPFFWQLFTFLLFFTAFADRLLWVLDLGAARAGRQTEKLVAQLKTELIMFGIVAISIFGVGFVTQLDSNGSMIVTFVDVLISFSACFVILEGAVIVLLHRVIEKNVLSLDLSERALAVKQYVAGEENKHLWSQPWRKQFEGVGHWFSLTHASVAGKAGFSFEALFDQTFTEAGCEMIAVDWKSWLVLCLFSVGFLVFPPSQDKLTYEKMWLGLMWGLCLLAVASFVYVRCKLKSFIETVVQPKLQEESDSGSDDPLEDFEKSVMNMIYPIQVCAMAMSFLLCFYFMHIDYQINKNEKDHQIIWRLCFFVPWILVVCWVMPATMFEYALLKACCSPSQELIDEVCREGDKEDFDLWQRQRSKQIADEESDA